MVKAVEKSDVIKDDLMDEEMRIRGTRVRVSDVAVDHDYHSLDPEEIAEEYSIEVSQVYKALSYYRENPEEVRRSIRNREKKLGDK